MWTWDEDTIYEKELNDSPDKSTTYYVAVDSEHLLPILENESSEPVPVFLTYPEELRNSKKVEAFKNFIISEIKAYQKTALK